MTRKKLEESLNISSTDDAVLIMEKIHCAALLKEGVDVTQRVLKTVVEWRDVLRDTGDYGKI